MSSDMLKYIGKHKSVVLCIELDIPPIQFDGMYNTYSDKNAKILDMSLNIEDYSDDDECISYEDGVSVDPYPKIKKDDEPRRFDITELTLVQDNSMSAIDSYIKRTYKFDEPPTEKDIFDKILLFEKEARLLSSWFDGIDTHHIYFEGLQWDRRHQAYSCMWGS